MPNSISFKNTAQKNARINDQMYTHQYRFEYDATGETTLELCISDILSFITDSPRDEAESIVRQQCQISIDNHFSMLDQVEKPQFDFWIDCLHITVKYNGEILVRKSQTPQEEPQKSDEVTGQSQEE
ncbi:hypothetical protein GCM10009000_063980 [Halobacterium noricense]|uniref:Halobacterial output domain-containing protein n=1 Tax=Haladaptatus pallidirubidus TaxID=1008152 RepID=A0AAV3UI91_9EURY